MKFHRSPVLWITLCIITLAIIGTSWLFVTVYRPAEIGRVCVSIIKASDPTNNPADPIKYEQCLITNKVTPDKTAHAAAEAERQQMALADQAAQQKAAKEKRISDLVGAIGTDVAKAHGLWMSTCQKELAPSICTNWQLDTAINNDLAKYGTTLQFTVRPGVAFWAAVPGMSEFVCTDNRGGDDYNIQSADPANATKGGCT